MRRALKRGRGFYPAGTVVDVWYRSYPYCAAKVVEDGCSIGGIHEEKDLCEISPRLVVSV